MDKKFRAYFLDGRRPHVVRHEMEKRCGELLHRVERAEPLTYRAEAGGCGIFEVEVELTLEGAGADGAVYGFQMRVIKDDDEAARGAFDYWLRDWAVTARKPAGIAARGAKYRALVAQAEEFDAEQAARREDPAAIAAAQEAVWRALQGGKRYAAGHHEGVTSLGMRDGVLWKTDEGVEYSEVRREGREEILAYVRAYFDWDATKDTKPHKPPEAEIWKFILRQLR